MAQQLTGLVQKHVGHSFILWTTNKKNRITLCHTNINTQKRNQLTEFRLAIDKKMFLQEAYYLFILFFISHTVICHSELKAGQARAKAGVGQWQLMG